VNPSRWTTAPQGEDSGAPRAEVGEGNQHNIPNHIECLDQANVTSF
jgi:hypothetical protein